MIRTVKACRYKVIYVEQYTEMGLLNLKRNLGLRERSKVVVYTYRMCSAVKAQGFFQLDLEVRTSDSR